MDKVEPYDCWEGVINGCLEDKDLDNILSILDYPIDSFEVDTFTEEWDATKTRCLGPILPEMLTETGPLLLPSSTHANATDEPPNQLSHQPKDTTSCPHTNKFTDAQNEVMVFYTQSPVSVLEGNNAPSSLIKCKRTRSKRARASGPSPWLSMQPPSFAAAKKARKVRRDESLDHAEASHNGIKKCVHCEVTKTPQWREGPMGPKTLCNACGVRYRSGRLFPEYRPAASPTFVPSMHSNSHRKVIEMRNKTRSEGEIVGPAQMSPEMEFVPVSSYLLEHLG